MVNILWAIRVISLLTLVVLLFTLSGCGSKESDIVYQGVVQDKIFQKGTTSTGLAVTSSGQPIITTQEDSDKYIIFVDDIDFTVNKDEWFNLEKGDTVHYKKKLGGIVQVIVPPPTSDG